MLSDPRWIDVRDDLACGRNVEIDINALFIGRVSLGANWRGCTDRSIRASAAWDSAGQGCASR